MSRNMRAADAPPANMRRTEGSAVVPAKPAAMSAKAREVSAATVSAASATMSASAATMPAASAAAGVCLECEKRHDEEQYRDHASASRRH
jgi:N-methylhydantoinase B/oxoprolinase/acetone carboxylase alpha subunit